MIFKNIKINILPILTIICLFLIPQNLCAQFGEKLPGIISNIQFEPDEKILYLTLDACGGTNGNGYDKKLIDFLTKNKIPATLFINARWIDKNQEIFKELSENKLFEIENHGMNHKPASTTGKSVYGIAGTLDKESLIAEIVPNADKIEKLTGNRPNWYRSGTAYYDSESVKIITNELGLKIAGFAISIDAGATLSASFVAKNTMSAKSGDILLGHFNKPASGTADGIIKALPILLKQGYEFKQLQYFEKKR